MSLTYIYIFFAVFSNACIGAAVIRNESWRVQPMPSEPIQQAVERTKPQGSHLLRFAINSVGPNGQLQIEAAVVNGLDLKEYPDQGSQLRVERGAVALLVPTGIQLSIGGYAGDAGAVTNLIAGVSSHLVVNPNAVNASNFISLPKNALYTEGRMIDLFMQNRIRLEPKRNSRIGLIAEPADQASLSLIDNIANTVEQTHGVEIVRILTSEKVNPNVTRTPSGAYVGTVGDPMTLLRAAKTLVKEGVQALAITTNIRGYDEKDYREHFSGGHPNPIGGVEAIMSHLVTNETGFPAAHGPMINFKPGEIKETVVDPRSAGEHVSQSGLASVLIGLIQAPRIIRNGGSGLGVDSLTAVVVPATALGSIPVLEAHQRGIPIIAVRQNSSILNVTARDLNLSNVLEVDSYLEAAAAIERLQRGEALSSLQNMNTKRLLHGEGLSIADRLGLSKTVLEEQGKNRRNSCVRSLLLQSEAS